MYINLIFTLAHATTCSLPMCHLSHQSDLGLNIREAHAFNTSDKFSLDVFVVDQWEHEVSNSTWMSLEGRPGGDRNEVVVKIVYERQLNG